MEIKETRCRCCRYEKTNFGFIYCEDIVPICKLCVKFIKTLKLSDIKSSTKVSQNDTNTSSK